MRSAKHVAAILGVMFHEFGQPRVRITEKTLRAIGHREHLRDSHKAAVADALGDLGLTFIEVPRGFIIMRFSSLDGTKATTFKAFRLSTEKAYKDEEEIWKIAVKALAENESSGDDDE